MSSAQNSLNGKRILVTRPEQQNVVLTQLIEQHGGQAIVFPTLEIVSIENTPSVKQQLENFKSYQWLIFISSNAVNFAVTANNGKIESFKQSKIAAIGKATAKALQNAGLTVDLLPETCFNSESLLAMPALQNIAQQNILIIRGRGGRETLAQELQKRGANVEYWEVYQRQMPVIDTLPVVNLLNQQQLDILTITSVDALQNLLTMLKPHIFLLIAIPLIVISERIKQAAEAIGFKTIVVSSNPDDRAIFNTMIMLTNGEYRD